MISNVKPNSSFRKLQIVVVDRFSGRIASDQRPLDQSAPRQSIAALGDTVGWWRRSNAPTARDREMTRCPCCRAPRHVIGEETSRRPDVVSAQFRVIVTHRPKYGCRACTDGVVQAPAPERLIKGGLPTEAMVAHVPVAKYAWHLPLCRQVQVLLAQGIDIKRSVLAFWGGHAAVELRPLWLRLRRSF